MKKAKIALATLAACFMLAPTTALAAEETKYEEGWQDNYTWYQFEDGTYAKDGIYPATLTDGSVDEDGNPLMTLYAFDENGYLVTGWYEYEDHWFYADPSTAELVKNWQKIDGAWYYFYDDMIDSTLELPYMFENDTFRLYEDEDDEEGTLYCFDEDGALTTGWYYNPGDYDWYAGTWYYSDSNGVAQTGWQKIDGTYYFFDEDWGNMATSQVIYQQKDAEGNEFYDTYLGDSPVYDEDGYIVDWEDNELIARYRVDRSGAMITGWHNAAPYSTDGTWYYANSDGTLREEADWLSSGGYWYWIDERGSMTTNKYIYYVEYEDGETTYGPSIESRYDEDGNYIEYEITNTYYIGYEGYMIDGWYHDVASNDTGYYSDSWKYSWVGYGLWRGWLSDGGNWYFTDASGNMVRCGTYFTGDWDNAPEEPETPDVEYPDYPSLDYDDFRDEDGYIDWDAYDEAYDKAMEEYRDAVEKYNDTWDEYNDAYEQWQIDEYDWKIDNTYVFDTFGKMVTGGWYGYTSDWGTTWYYANADGTVYDGWLNDGGYWYYIDEGVMLRSKYTPDGYWVGADGICY